MKTALLPLVGLGLVSFYLFGVGVAVFRIGNRPKADHISHRRINVLDVCRRLCS